MSTPTTGLWRCDWWDSTQHTTWHETREQAEAEARLHPPATRLLGYGRVADPEPVVYEVTLWGVGEEVA